jgi:hypothetical protein
MEPLPLRPASDRHAPADLPPALSVDPASDHEGLPALTGELPRPAPRRMRLVLRVHNAAGVPIAAGEAHVGAGEARVEFRALHALGIEAYAHVPADERVRIARRIWSRRAYGVLSAGE